MGAIRTRVQDVRRAQVGNPCLPLISPFLSFLLCAIEIRANEGFYPGSFAMAELYLALAYLIRTLDLELYETTREKDIDIIRDCFIGEVAASSKGVRVTFA